MPRSKTSAKKRFQSGAWPALKDRTVELRPPPSFTPRSLNTMACTLSIGRTSFKRPSRAASRKSTAPRSFMERELSMTITRLTGVAWLYSSGSTETIRALWIPTPIAKSCGPSPRIGSPSGPMTETTACWGFATGSIAIWDWNPGVFTRRSSTVLPCRGAARIINNTNKAQPFFRMSSPSTQPIIGERLRLTSAAPGSARANR